MCDDIKFQAITPQYPLQKFISFQSRHHHSVQVTSTETVIKLSLGGFITVDVDLAFYLIFSILQQPI